MLFSAVQCIWHTSLFTLWSWFPLLWSDVSQSFQWMSRVLHAVDSIHQAGIYCLALVPPNYLPKVLYLTLICGTVVACETRQLIFPMS